MPNSPRTQQILTDRAAWGRPPIQTSVALCERWAEAAKLLESGMMFADNEWRLLYFLAPSVLAFFAPPERVAELPRALYNHPGFWTAHNHLVGAGDTAWRRNLRQKLQLLSPVQRLALADRLERSAWRGKTVSMLRVGGEPPQPVPEAAPLRPVGRLPMALDAGCNPKIHPNFNAKRRYTCPACRRGTAMANRGGISFEYRSAHYHEWCIISMWRHNPHVLKRLVTILAEKKPKYWGKILDSLSKMGFLD